MKHSLYLIHKEGKLLQWQPEIWKWRFYHQLQLFALMECMWCCLPVKLRLQRNGKVNQLAFFGMLKQVCLCVILFDSALTPLFNNISVILHGQFYWWRKPLYPERTTNFGQVTDKPFHMRCKLNFTCFYMVQSQRNGKVNQLAFFGM